MSNDDFIRGVEWAYSVGERLEDYMVSLCERPAVPAADLTIRAQSERRRHNLRLVRAELARIRDREVAGLRGIAAPAVPPSRLRQPGHPAPEGLGAWEHEQDRDLARTADDLRSEMWT